MQKPLLVLITLLFLLLSCKKDSFTNSGNAQIGFSADSVYFDTVFTTAGSVTQSVKVYNSNDQKILLTDIQLAGGSNSPFSININGAPGPQAGNITLGANDSLYIFIKVLIKASATPRPFILNDSIRISFNGNQAYIKLSAWGQNAHFLSSQHISSNTTWVNDMPYVIAGSLTVDSNTTLSMTAGTRVYFHADAPMLVDGTLQVSGNVSDSQQVIFASDRLDAPYADYPGGWPGIYFRTQSKDNSLTYATIKNAYQAIVAEDPATDAAPKLILNQCRIDNASDAGILALHSSIQAKNCLISNCAENISIGYGGTYSFEHCTIAAYANNYLSHQQPVLTVTNYILNGVQILTADLQADFTNCILWGSSGDVDDELVASVQPGNSFVLNLSHCLLRQKNFPAGVDASTVILNQDPQFVKIDNNRVSYDFHLQPGSPALGQGANTSLLTDLDGKVRPAIAPDLGCFENQ